MSTTTQTDDLDTMLRRLHMPTIRRLHSELALRAEQEGMSYRTFLEILCAEEIAHRSQTRITRSVHKARFPFLRTIEEFDFTFQTSFRLQMLGSMLGPELVSDGRCAIFSDPPGVGKSHLAVSLGVKAVKNGFSTPHFVLDDLMHQLKSDAAKPPARLKAKRYLNTALLINRRNRFPAARPP
jgi:DNA replication protein DnaC